MLYDASKKSVAVAYLLWFFFWMLGAHRFYAGRPASGLLMAGSSVLVLLFFVTMPAILILWGVVGIWALIDAVLLPGMIRDINTSIAMRVSS